MSTRAQKLLAEATPHVHSTVGEALTCHAQLVNRLPDYEAAVEALERLLAALEGSAWAEKHRAHAAAALARLREKVPA